MPRAEDFFSVLSEEANAVNDASEPESAPADVAKDEPVDEPKTDETVTDEPVDTKSTDEPADTDEPKPEDTDDKTDVDDLVDKKDEDKPEEPKEELFEVKVDGEKEQVSKEELIKSYERYGASTRRFQQASEIKKQSEEAKANADKTVQQARSALNTLLTNPDAILDIIGGNAPETLHKAFEKYAKQHVADQELREKDQNLYDATLEQRRREADIKRQQDEIARQRKEIEAAQNQSKQERENQVAQKTHEVYERSATESLKAVGLPDDIANSRMIRESFKSFVQSAWTDGLLIKDVPALVAECAKEFAKDPFVKNMIGARKPEPKKEPEPKPEPKKEEPKRATVHNRKAGSKTHGKRAEDFFRL